MSGVDVLTSSVAIVDRMGQPTKEFMIKWAQLANSLAGIIPLGTAAEVSTVLDLLGDSVGGMLIRGGSEWEEMTLGGTYDVLMAGPGLPQWQPLGDVLDNAYSSTQGSILYRGASGWAALGPGTAGYVLTTHGASANPTWAAGGGGGTLAGLSDVSITSPSDGQYLVYKSGTSKWTNETVANVGTPPSVVQFNYTSVAASAVPSVTMGAAPTNGNLLVAWVMTNGAAPATNTAGGWSQISAQSSGLWYFWLLTKTAGASEPTTQSPVTGGSSSYWTIGIYEVAGQNVSTPVVLDATVYGPNQSFGVTPATLPAAPSTVSLMCIVPAVAQTDYCKNVFGQAVLDANLSSAAGAHAAFGHSDSNAPVYAMAAAFDNSVFYDSGMIVITH